MGHDQYIAPDNSYYKPSRDPNEDTMKLVVFMTVLFVVLTTVLAVVYFKKQKGNVQPGNSNSTDVSSYISVASPTPTPIPELQSYQNPLLYPGVAQINSTIDSTAISKDALPSARALQETILIGKDVVTNYNREKPIFFGDPINYGSVPGIFTFRGNNFRNCAAFGYTQISSGTLTQTWEYKKIGSLLASTLSFEWTGLRWTGQPLAVKWNQNTKNHMNLFDSAKNKANLTEVIVAALDGKIHFMDLETGEATRNPINVGASMKGTPALDPRGYPIIYVGQCDNNGTTDTFGMYVYSLIDGKLLYKYDGSLDGAYRSHWNAFDSSPIINAETDTLIWPCENGMIYTFNLNTSYSEGTGEISMNPTCTGYKYIFNDTSGIYLGVESSIACYGNLGYFMDNTRDLVCIDLNTLKMVWCVRVGDDSDVTPMINEENGVPYIYIGTEVDNQGGQGQYCGAAYVYKVNGLTGEIVWQTSQPCYTYNGETSDTDQSGGCFGNPVYVKNPDRNKSDLVVFSFSMTNNLASGNKLVAYDKDLGTVVWEYNMNIYSYSSPVCVYDSEGNPYILIADSIGQIHLVDAITTEENPNTHKTVAKRICYIQTQKRLGTSEATSSGVCFEASPIVIENTMVIGTTSGSVFGIKIG